MLNFFVNSLETLQKQPPEVFFKNVNLKHFAIFTEAFKSQINRNVLDEAESTSKLECLLRQVESRIAESVFVSSNQTSLNWFKNRAAESNFIHFSFCLYQPTYVSSNWNFPFFLSYWCSFFKFLLRFSHVFFIFCHELSFCKMKRVQL